MLGDDEDVFDSVTWESASAAPAYEPQAVLHSGPGFKQSNTDSEGPNDPKWEGYLITAVKDPVKELAETKDAYVSYLVQARVISSSVLSRCVSTYPYQTNLSIFSVPNPSARRRFQDFVFLRENLARDFPACVVPPLPDKHRLGVLHPKYLA